MALRGWPSCVTASAGEALPLTVGTGHPGLSALPTAQLALIAALRGDDATERHLDEVTATRDKHRVGITDGIVADLTHWTRGLRAAAQPSTGLHHLERIEGPAWRRLAALDLFDAAIRGNRPDIARTWLAELEQFTAGTGPRAATAIVEHGRALLAGDGETETHFQRALAAHADSPGCPTVPTPTWPSASICAAPAAGSTPASTCAPRWRCSRTSAPPRGPSGPHKNCAPPARRRDVTTAADLTPQERQVAALVRQGLSNRDVAAQLFVSSRTVDFHLRNCYSELGVSSRSRFTALPLDL
ncbi:LuxR C-terminal-related transcriptional regulator [Streptomyces carpinensis]|nr:helix-turn-helix transcriptional regulator [Streptomyces carpinensis]